MDGNSGCGEGDWNCDGDFNSTDLVRSFAAGGYVGAVRPALREVAAALDSIYADRDSKTRLPSVRRVKIPLLTGQEQLCGGSIPGLSTI